MALGALRTIFVVYREMSMEAFNEIKEANNDFANETDKHALD
jgi:hypothetical protein